MATASQARTSREAKVGRNVSFAMATDAPDLQIQSARHGGDHCETAETYRGELFRLGRYRVAVCRDAYQWLLQRRRPGFTGGGTAWDTLGYCRTREALIRLHRSCTGCEAPELNDLPEFFPREGTK